MATAGADAVMVNAAGNSAMPVAQNPWSYLAARFSIGNVLTAASIRSDGTLSYSSSFGDMVDIAAPGANVLSTETDLLSLESPPSFEHSYYDTNSGTSMAAPIVAGVAALVAERHPDWTGRQLAACLRTSATSTVKQREAADGLQFAYTDEIPLLDAAAAVSCSFVDPPTDQAGAEYIARDPGTGRSVLVANGGVKNIANGGTFLCLAKTRLVWNIANLKALAEATTGNAGCDNTGRVEWDIRPGTPPDGGNVGRNVLLRDTDGKPWFINQAGEAQAVVDLLGGVRTCLESRHPIIWNADPTKIADWTPVGVPLANLPHSGPRHRRDSRVSVASDGTQSNDWSDDAAISADGRFVTYSSGASNLVPGDTNGEYDVFLYDQQTRITSRISVTPDGTQANGGSGLPTISADGRYVAYSSEASNLVAGDTDTLIDVFLLDRQTGVTSRVSYSAGGSGQDDRLAEDPALSADGRYLTYTCGGVCAVPGDTNGEYDVYLFDRQTGTTSLVSVATDGTPGIGLPGLRPSPVTAGTSPTVSSDDAGCQ